MKRFLTLKVVLAAAIILALGSAPALMAQVDDPLSEGDAKKLLKASSKSLKKAENALDQDNPGQAAEHAARYAETMATISEALARGDVRQNDLVDVVERVDNATSKHEAKLLELLETTPEAAHEGLMKALEASRMGRERATAALLEHGQAELPNGVLDRRAAAAIGKQNNALLRQANRAQGRGDTTTVGLSVDQVAANLGVVNQAMSEGAIDERNAISVLDRVNRDTRRQAEKLEGLFEKVPEQAWPAIQRAIEQSARGQQESAAALQRSRAAGVQSGWPGAGGNPGIGGRPSGAGAGGGRPSGAGPPAGRGPGSRPGGRP